jgi:hypothetical protein
MHGGHRRRTRSRRRNDRLEAIDRLARLMLKSHESIDGERFRDALAASTELR